MANQASGAVLASSSTSTVKSNDGLDNKDSTIQSPQTQHTDTQVTSSQTTGEKKLPNEDKDEGEDEDGYSDSESEKEQVDPRSLGLKGRGPRQQLVAVVRGHSGNTGSVKK